MGKSIPLENRFWEKVKKKKGCWEWQGGRYKLGYGVFRTRYNPNISIADHRQSWIIKFGAIPEGLCVCHKCDNPPCVNPKHLWIGTKADNNRDRKLKGRTVSLHGSAHPNAKFKESDIIKIRKIYKTGKHTYQSLASHYGVGKNTIFRILKRIWWKHI